MKKVLLVLAFFAVSAQAGTTKEEKICSQLEEQAWDNCRKSICADWITGNGEKATRKAIEECLRNSDGDLNEGAQICVSDGGELESLIEAYNKKNPRQKVKCEQD